MNEILQERCEVCGVNIEKIEIEEMVLMSEEVPNAHMTPYKSSYNSRTMMLGNKDLSE